LLRQTPAPALRGAVAKLAGHDDAGQHVGYARLPQGCKGGVGAAAWPGPSPSVQAGTRKTNLTSLTTNVQ
jgi:hypothetical protein